MRVLWNGIGPWHRTGYGGQTAIFADRLRAAGHHVVIAVMGQPGMNERHPDYANPWRGIEVLAMDHTRPGRVNGEFGLPRPAAIRQAFGGHDPDVVIVLKDAWVLTPDEYRPYNAAVWTNVDCEPMGAPDREFFATGAARPIATSVHGQRMMLAAGLDPLFVPHAIVGADWSVAGREEAREFLGLTGFPFVVGINAQNTSIRKAFAEQMEAFARFHAKHPGSLLLMHTNPVHPQGMNLRELAYELRLARHPDRADPSDAVKFGAHMIQKTGQMRAWYQALDVLCNATYGEGFGLPILEAMACGVPVIGTRGSAVSEKIPTGAGWLTSGQRLWVPPMRAWWRIPSVDRLVENLGKAYRSPGPPEARTWVAAEYDADFVTRQYWKGALDELTR